MTSLNDLDIVFEPIPGSSQELALDSRCNYTLYEGTRGPGKTITQLMRFRSRVGIGYGSYWRGIIFDAEFKNLSDLVAQSLRFFNSFQDGCKFLHSASEYKWIWPSGEELLFRHASKIGDYENFHGHEYPFIGFNELTKHATPDLHDKLLSTNRSSFDPKKHTPKLLDSRGKPIPGKYDTPNREPLPPIPLEVFSTTNPSGIGHNWVKKRFIDPAPRGTVVTTDYEVFNPKTQKDEIVTLSQVAIFGSYRENIYLPPEYIATLDRLTAGNQNLHNAWLKGSWDITAGGALDDLWDSKVHIVPRFKIPSNWRIDRSFDWGQSSPYSVCWWAEANGEEVELPDGRTWCPEPGSLIQIEELYGSKEIGTNKGTGEPAREVAKKIRDIEIELLRDGWILKQPFAGPADNSINKTEDESDSIGQKMASEGIRWEPSDKSAGSRVNGLQLVRERLYYAIHGENPGLYFMRNCQASIETLPSIPRDEKNPEDVDTKSEDHVYDAARYRVLKDAHRFVKHINGRLGN